LRTLATGKTGFVRGRGSVHPVYSVQNLKADLRKRKRRETKKVRVSSRIYRKNKSLPAKMQPPERDRPFSEKFGRRSSSRFVGSQSVRVPVVRGDLRERGCATSRLVGREIGVNTAGKRADSVNWLIARTFPRVQGPSRVRAIGNAASSR